MPNSIATGNSSNTIILVLLENLERWKDAQQESIQSWLKAHNFQGPGVLMLPTEASERTTHLYVIKSHDEFFLSGDLPNQLPEKDYSFNLGEDASLAALQSTDQDDLIFRLAASWGLAAYTFDRYKKASRKPATLLVDTPSALEKAGHFCDAIALTRDLVNTPANDMMPQDLADTLEALATEFKADFRQITGDALLDENYPLIHAVGRASEHAPRLLELVWGDASAPKITLVGKGICFDSGGLNIKTGNFMRQMKKDMGGAAHVIGLARLVMAQKLNLHLRVLVPAAENAIAGNAFRPGDVITSRKGLTIEIDNTDAEGRLVLCDALNDACEQDPELVIDFATLTGACRVALGTELPGFFCNDEKTAQELTDSSSRCLDPVWRLPLYPAYNDMLKSDVADLVNSASSGYGGAITAALYLQRFVPDNTRWIHFDVMAWNLRPLPGRPVGGEAMGLRAVFELLAKRYG